MITILKRLSALFLLLIFSCSNIFAARTFIIDTDVGIDDVIAIAYLLQAPEIKVKAITIVSTGNSHCLPAFQNTLGLLKLLKHTDIPVDCGPLKPLSGQHTFSEKMLEEGDTLAGTAKLLPKVNHTPQQKGVDLLINTIQESKQPVTIVALGPLTNIASALQRQPEIKNRIQAIYIMGGAIDVPGNLSSPEFKINNKTAEWNMYIDPIAASIVFNQSIPINLIPLDVTNTLPIDMAFYDKLKKNHRSPAANFVYTLFKNNMKLLKDKQWYFWDPLAAVIASDESISSFNFKPLKVSLSPEHHLGRITVDSMLGQNIRIAEKVNANRFKSLLIDGLIKT